MENGRFGSKSFRNKSFWYELKQWNCTKISFTSGKVFTGTRKTFWVNALRSLSQVSGTFYCSTEQTCIETTLYRNDPYPISWPSKCALCFGGHSESVRQAVKPPKATSSHKRSATCIQNSEILIVKLLQWEQPLKLQRLRPTMWMEA